MKKKSLKESLLKMRYLSGLITESQMNEFYKEGDYFADDNKSFSDESTEDVEGLFNSLINDGVVDFKFYPDWVFNALNDENYIEQKGDSGAWFLSLEGQSVFRDARKLQQYLISVDEDKDAVNVEAGGEKLDEDISNEQMTSYYKDQIYGVTPHGEYPPAIKINARAGGNDTKWLTLNKESAAILVQWLQENFLS